MTFVYVSSKLPVHPPPAIVETIERPLFTALNVRDAAPVGSAQG